MIEIVLPILVLPAIAGPLLIASIFWFVAALFFYMAVKIDGIFAGFFYIFFVGGFLMLIPVFFVPDYGLQLVNISWSLP